jgi:putative solute:sodium symporter small subunit
MDYAEILWRKQRRLTLVLLVIWLLVTFVTSWYADILNEVTLFDFPLGFYMGAQGLLFIYLAIIWYYNRSMRKLEARFGMEDN